MRGYFRLVCPDLLIFLTRTHGPWGTWAGGEGDPTLVKMKRKYNAVQIKLDCNQKRCVRGGCKGVRYGSVGGNADRVVLTKQKVDLKYRKVSTVIMFVRIFLEVRPFFYGRIRIQSLLVNSVPLVQWVDTQHPFRGLHLICEKKIEGGKGRKVMGLLFITKRG